MAGQSTYTSIWRGPLWTRLLAVPGIFLMMIGIIGFVGRFAVGSRLSSTFELPVGRADGVITMPNGYHVVPLLGSSRIQVYDQNWRFLRGWYVEAGGRTLYLAPSQQDQFEVFTQSRSSTGTAGLHCVFNLDGQLISRGTQFLDASTFNSTIVSQGKSVLVPTPIWGWLFVPIYAWLTVLCGMLMLGVVNLYHILGRWTTAVIATRRETWTYIETEQPPR